MNVHLNPQDGHEKSGINTLQGGQKKLEIRSIEAHCSARWTFPAMPQGGHDSLALSILRLADGKKKIDPS